MSDTPEPELLSPSTPYELSAGLRRLRETGGRLGVDAQLERSRLDEVGAVEPLSGLVTVGAGVVLGELESALSPHGLWLGALSPRARSLEVGAFLEGPYGGLRVLSQGRLEPLAIAISAMLPDGRVWKSHCSPRRAAGPELSALFFGAAGRYGLILSATLRCSPKPLAARMELHSFPEAALALDALKAAVADGCSVERARLERQGERVFLEVSLGGSIEGVEEDLSTLKRNVASRSGRSSTQVPRSPSAHEEREARWEAVQAAVEGNSPVTLYRLSLASVIAVGEVEGLELSPRSSWSPAGALQDLALRIDPSSVLAGAP